MYDPVSPTVLLYMALASTAVAAGSAVYQGQQANKTAKYNAQVSEQNAIAAQQKAAYDEKLHRERVRKLLSSQKAAYGKSGVDMAGSPLLVLQETVEQGELDALAIRYGGSIEASRNRSAATLARMEGRAARTSSYAQAGSTLLSGGSQAADRYNKAKVK